MVLPDFLDFQIFKHGRMGIVITSGNFFGRFFVEPWKRLMSNLTKAAHFELNDSVNLRGKKHV